MPVLCLDTSTSQVVVALLDGAEGAVTSRTSTARAQALLEVVDEVLAEAGRPSIEAVVVGVGPGGFTGVRIGVTTARGIAEALGVPLYGVNSLLAVAIDVAMEFPDEVVWGTIDARRGEHFVQPFEVGAGGHVTPVEPARAVPTADLDDLEGIVVANDGIDPQALARAARQLLGSVDGVGDPLAVVPDYVRAPDAEPARMLLRIDPLTTADLDALLRLEARCFPTPWSRRMYEEELARPAVDAVCLGARDDAVGGRLVGAALASRIGDSWHVMNVLVDPGARRRGIASLLIEQLLDRTAAVGVDDGWTLEVRDGNVGAIELYRRHGFVSSGTRRGYYADTGEDAIVMWRMAGSEVSA
jgi:tRNA threonylcarbamoyl adenosine modification protein YeaZ/ribosomal-protein-alanine acetyltransferase